MFPGSRTNEPGNTRFRVFSNLGVNSQATAYDQSEANEKKSRSEATRNSEKSKKQGFFLKQQSEENSAIAKNKRSEFRLFE